MTPEPDEETGQEGSTQPRGPRFPGSGIIRDVLNDPDLGAAVFDGGIRALGAAVDITTKAMYLAGDTATAAAGAVADGVTSVDVGALASAAVDLVGDVASTAADALGAVDPGAVASTASDVAGSIASAAVDIVSNLDAGAIADVAGEVLGAVAEGIGDALS